jgi:hypothetical protein
MLDFVSDYCSSENFLFLDGKAKEHAEELLVYFSTKAGDVLTFERINSTIEEMAHLDLPFEARKTVPALLESFFTYLNDNGKIPDTLRFARHIAQVSTHYEERFREDGSVRGTTFTKKYTDVGRNDLCPCGSQKKFKKCCMGLIQ